MYKDKEKAKAASKERMRKMRQGVTKGVTEGVTSSTSEGVTSGVTKPQGVTRVKAKGVTGCNKGVTSGYDIANKLVDPIWRDRLTRICSQFHKSSLAHDVQLGVNGPDLSVVEEMLEITA